MNDESKLELLHSLQAYSDLYQFAPIPYFTLNALGLIVDVNDAGLDLIGHPKNSLVNRCFSQYIVPEQQLRFSAFRQSV